MRLHYLLMDPGTQEIVFIVGGGVVSGLLGVCAYFLKGVGTKIEANTELVAKVGSTVNLHQQKLSDQAEDIGELKARLSALEKGSTTLGTGHAVMEGRLSHLEQRLADWSQARRRNTPP